MRLTNYFPRLTKLALDPIEYFSRAGGLPDYTTSYRDFKPQPLGSEHNQDDLQFTDAEAGIQPFKDPYNGYFIEEEQDTQSAPVNNTQVAQAAKPPQRPRQQQTPRLDSNGFNQQQAKVYDLYRQGRVAKDALPSSMRSQVARLDANRQSQPQATVGPSSYKPNTGEFNMNSPIPNSNPSAPRMQAVQAPKPQGIQNNMSSTNVGSRIPSVTAPNMSKSPLQLGNSNFKSMGSGNTSTKA